MASNPITSWQIDGEQLETVTDFIFLGSKITVDGDGRHKIKRHLLLGRNHEPWKWKLLSYVQLLATPWTVVHGILQARILEWVAFPFSRVSSQPRDWTQVSLFLTQDLNWGLPHCRQILYQLSYQVGKGQSERGRASRMVMWNGQSLGKGKAKHQPLSSQGRGQSWVKSPRGVSAFFPPEFSLSKEFSLYFIERWGLKP